ncbi:MULTISPECIES: hypothetical protein [unclassified Streptomyces]|uniref:hypothetical protein n=1 Tax=unclassified Streptomyces TaxID=2593676 RepID=UPI00093AAA0B|nr:hypothetical protein [Streptomyces sp. TSRI0281]OKI32113.1 hypothetical protein A6A29_21420 [Streptomyces sp. TSRI0281]
MTQETGGTLLDYTIVSDPYPLCASLNAGTPTSTLHILIAPPGDETVHCQDIQFAVPYGSGAHDLVSVQGGQGSSPDNWTVTWEPAKSVFLAVPPSGSGGTVGAAGVQLTLKGLHINTRPGIATIEIAEMAGITTGSYSMQRDECTVTKFPRPAVPAQNVSDFAATTPEVDAGNTVTLYWTGPQTLTYDIAHGTGATPATGQAETNITNFTWKGTVTRDTTFHLHCRLGETTHTLTATVAVNNPRLTGLQVDGTLIANGQVEAVATDRSVRIRELQGPSSMPLTIKSSTDFLAGCPVSVTDSVTVTGKLIANGDLQAIHEDHCVRIRDLRGPMAGPLTINSSGIEYIDSKHPVNLAGNLIAKNDVTVTGKLVANGGIEAVAADKLVRIRKLLGPYGQPLEINSSTNFLAGCNVHIAGEMKGSVGQFAQYGDTMHIQNKTKSNCYLGASVKGDKTHASNWNSWTYWASSRDNETYLVMKKG